MLNIFKKNTIFGRNTNSDLPLYYDNIELEGKTTQETRSGKNLFDINGNINTRYNGTTSNYNSANGNNFVTTFSNQNGYAYGQRIYVGSGNQITISAKVIDIQSTNTKEVGIYIFNDKTTSGASGLTISELNVIKSLSFTPTTDYVIVTFSGKYSGFQSATFTDIQVELGSTATEWEQYGAMPSPDYPSELVSVGYENLFDGVFETGIYNGNTGAKVNIGGYIRCANYIPVKELTDYTFSVDTTSFNVFLVYEYKEDKTYNLTTNKAAYFNQKYTTNKGTKYITFRPNAAFTDTSIKVQITEGTQAHSYIPYGKYGIEVKTIGKNLFNKNNYLWAYFEGSGSSITSTNTRNITFFVKCEPNTTYTLKATPLQVNQIRIGIIVEYPKIGSIVSNVYTASVSQITNGLQYTTSSNAQYIVIRLQTPVGTNIDILNLDNYLKNVQLEEGNQATSYEPYIGHTNLIILDNPLRSIGDTKDLLYIKNGMLYVERKIGNVVLNGSESWTKRNDGDGSTTITFNINLSNVGAYGTSNVNCDTFTYEQSSTSGNEGIGFASDLITQYIQIKRTRLSSLDVTGFKSWLSTHNTEVQYELATPTIETYELDIQPMIFDSLGYGTLSDVVSDPLITEELNGSYILELEYMKNGKFSEYLVEENIIKAHGEPFSIYSVEKDTDEKIKILAKHWVINEWDKDFILDSAPTDLTAQNALAWIQQRSINHSDISISGDCTTTSTARYVRKNMLSAIFKEDNAILTRFGGELSYNKNNVSVNKHRGSLSGLTIRQGKNLTGAKYYLDFSTVTTRLVPVGKDGLMLDEVYVDSPLINNYATPIIRKVEVNTTSEDELRSYCNKLYENGLDKPTVSIKIDFIELSKTDEYKQYSSLETAHLGDEVTAYIPSLNLNVSTRIVKTVYNDNLKRITALELGSVTPNIATSSVNVEKNLQKQVEQLAANDSLILDEAKEEASNLIKHPFGGYIYIDETTGNMYIMDTNNINTAQNVWRWGLGGLGFSSTGVNGTYGIAMTQDGKIVADYIKSGTLQSVTIKATNGTVGGYKIGENKLYAETYSSYNFDSSDLTAIRNYLMDEGSLSDDELIKYDIDGNGVVDSRDYVLIRNFIELGVTKNKSAKIIMQTGNNIFENAYILQDANENDILNINFNGFMYDHPNNGKFNLSGSKLTLTDINNNSMTISPDWLPKSVLSNWYSTSSTTLTDAKKHKLLVILGKPTSSSGIVSLIIPTDALSTSNQQFQCADESKYVAFNVRYNNDDVIITGAGRSSDGSILSAWTLL